MYFLELSQQLYPIILMERMIYNISTKKVDILLKFHQNHSRKVKHGFSNGQMVNIIPIVHQEGPSHLETITGMDIIPDRLDRNK